MDITKIQLEYRHRDSSVFALHDPLCHMKTLPYLSVVQAVEGSYDIQLRDGEMYTTGIGGFFIAPSDIRQTIVHHADPASKKMFCRWVFLKIKLNDLFDFDDLYEFPIIIPEPYQLEMHALFNRLFASANPFEEYACYYEIARLLFLLSKEKTRTFTSYLYTALAYIKNNYAGKITVADIAKEVNLSESHLFSLFKKELGTSPIAYLTSYRLSIAAGMLQNSNQTIAQIANAVGFEDSIYFNKLFRKTYQMSPSKYRKLYKNNKPDLSSKK